MVSPLLGIEQSIPYGKYTRVLKGIRLAHTTREPKVSTVFGIDAGTAAYYFIFVSDNEYFALNNGSLTILKSPNYEKLKVSDIQDFAQIINRELTHSSDMLQTSLKKLKEKRNNNKLQTPHHFLPPKK